MRCPWCRETVSILSRATQCPHCGRDLREASGERVRPLDLDFDAALVQADERAARWMKRGVIFAAVCALVGLVPPVAPFAYLLLIVAQFFFARFLVGRGYSRHFGTTRRFVTRWISRLVLVFLILPVHSAAFFVPLLGLVASPALFGGVLWAQRAYLRFHLLREKERLGVLAVEKLFLVLFGVFMLVASCVLGLLIYLGFITLEALGL